jgi:hypothetical protein
MLVYYMANWYSLRLFGIFWAHSVNFMVIWYVFPRLGTYVVPSKIWQPWSRWRTCPAKGIFMAKIICFGASSLASKKRRYKEYHPM